MPVIGSLNINMTAGVAGLEITSLVLPANFPPSSIAAFAAVLNQLRGEHLIRMDRNLRRCGGDDFQLEESGA